MNDTRSYSRELEHMPEPVLRALLDRLQDQPAGNKRLLHEEVRLVRSELRRRESLAAAAERDARSDAALRR